MEEDIKKYAERAGDVLVEFFNREKSNLKPPEEAAKELVESEKNLKSIESEFLSNSVDILYNYIKYKYPDEGFSENAEKLIAILKGISGKDDEETLKKTKLVYRQFVAEMQVVEDNIQAKHPEYKKKFV